MIEYFKDPLFIVGILAVLVGIALLIFFIKGEIM
jgi:hypothetical protein